MSSPAKKRKRNDHKPTEQPVRGLDYFFAKQKELERTKSENALQASNTQTPEVANGDNEYTLTDEELARKLQSEWADEDQKIQASQDGANPETSTGRILLASQEPVEDDEVEQSDDRNDDLGSKEDDTGRLTNTLALQSTALDEDTITANIPFDESPLTFEPSRYISDLRRHWAADGGHTSYALLTRCFVLINSTQSRIKIVDTMVNLLRTIIEADPNSLLPAVRTSPSHVMYLR